MIRKILFNFILGGTIFSLIYYTANVIKNPAISAIIVALPIAILSCYIINSTKTLKIYFEKLLGVLTITILTIGLMLFILNKVNISKTYIITFVLFIWIILQYSLYMINSKDK